VIITWKCSSPGGKRLLKARSAYLISECRDLGWVIKYIIL
jgi:hypothetical protein